MVDWLGYFLIRGIAAVVRLFPIEASLAVVRFFAFGVALIHSRKKVAYANLKAAFGDRFTPKERKRIVRRNFINLAQSFVEVLYSPKMNEAYVDKYIEMNNFELVQKAPSMGRGVIFLTAHYGNWELSQIAAAIKGEPIVVFARYQKRYPKLNAYLNGLREYHGSRSISKGIALRELIRTLRNKECVGFLGDQSGGKSGIWLDFFGRTTTSPPGFAVIAKRTGAWVLSTFIVRVRGPYHRLFIYPPINLVDTGNDEKDLKINLENYLKLLEEKISEYPEQWLWGHKRWKYTKTKHILVLSDGKAGHFAQSKAVYEKMREIKREKGYTGEEKVVEVRYKNVFAEKLFRFIALFIMPFAQGRLGILKWFLDKKSYLELKDFYADYIISAGASLIPLNLMLARENLAKSIVVMKPGFPYNFFKYDLAAIMEHDAPTRVKEPLFVTLAPNIISNERLEEFGRPLQKELGIGNKNCISFFIGGGSKHYRLNPKKVSHALEKILAFAENSGRQLLITTSRRTPDKVVQILKEKTKNRSSCPLVVIANENNRPNVTLAMMYLSEFLIVTEDSVSMISDAAASGKKTLILRVGEGSLPEKHYRFHQILINKGRAVVCFSADVDSRLKMLSFSKEPGPYTEEQVKIKRRLEKIL